MRQGIKNIILSFFLFSSMLFASEINAQIDFTSKSWENTLQEARDSSKYVFIDFRADWCTPCIQMERTTFKDSTLSAFVNKRFVSYKADTEKAVNDPLERKYRINQLPTLLVLDPNNTAVPLIRIIGYKPADILLDDLKSIRDKKGNKIFPN